MMGLRKRYCVEYVDGSIECFREDGFWGSEKGLIIKWSILGAFFFIFMLWLIGGYVHARQRLKKGKPLLAYHRFLVSYPNRAHYGQGAPQNQQSYYAPNGYPSAAPMGAQGWGAPPVYNGEAPPMYGGAGKPGEGGVEMGSVQGAQQSGVVGGDVEAQGQSLPPRPARTKAALRGFTERFRK